MYLNVKETAIYLSLPESFIMEKIREGKIRALHNGEEYLINKEQFNAHMNALEKLKKQLQSKEEDEDILLPDYDYKDED